MLTVRERRPGDEAAVAALLAATAERVAAAEPRIRLGREPGPGPALVGAAIAAAGPDLDGSTLWFSPQNPIAGRVWPHLGRRPYWTSWEHRA